MFLDVFAHLGWGRYTTAGRNKGTDSRLAQESTD
jgi:hypothetical protein